jgi:hypothetical protein
MANETNRWASLRPVHQPDVRGWTVVGADGRKVGQVRDLLADPHGDEARFFAVELDQTALEQDRVGSMASGGPGGEERISAGAYPADPNRPGGAVPRADDREGGSGRVESLHVLVPFAAARLKEKDEQVVLETLRESDLAKLPALA